MDWSSATSRVNVSVRGTGGASTLGRWTMILASVSAQKQSASLPWCSTNTHASVNVPSNTQSARKDSSSRTESVGVNAHTRSTAKHP